MAKPSKRSYGQLLAGMSIFVGSWVLVSYTPVTRIQHRYLFTDGVGAEKLDLRKEL
jgi:hypothetical protein